MKHTPSKITAVAFATLLGCAAPVFAAQADAAANGQSEMDVTMTVVPDNAPLPDAVAGVIALPSQAAGQAQDAAQKGIGTANQAINQGGIGQGSAEAHGAADANAGVGADVSTDAKGLGAGLSGEVKGGADIGAGISNDATDLRNQVGGGIGGSVGGGVAAGLKH